MDASFYSRLQKLFELYLNLACTKSCNQCTTNCIKKCIEC